MPKVTLLGAPGKTYHLNASNGIRYDFRSGEPVPNVPDSVAQFLQEQRDNKDEPMFLIGELAEADVPNAEPEGDSPEQNVDSGSRQTRFPSWP